MDVCTATAWLDEIPDDLAYPTSDTQLTFVADYNNADTPVAITDFTITRMDAGNPCKNSANYVDNPFVLDQTTGVLKLAPTAAGKLRAFDHEPCTQWVQRLSSRVDSQSGLRSPSPPPPPPPLSPSPK